jgi:hypothetical protein
VSRSSRNQIRIGLCPEQLIVAQASRGWRRTAPDQRIIAVEPKDDTAGWHAAVDTLPAALVPGSAVTVVLSNHFVRYALLPWNPSLTRDDEWLAFARHRLALVHGNATEEWVVRCAETSPRGPRLACAVDRALLAVLDETISAGGATLISVQPYLMAAFNHIRLAIGNGPGWAVVHEPGRLTLALIQDGVWAALRTRRVDERWRMNLADILERESSVLALDQSCTQVYVYTQEPFETGADGVFSMSAMPVASNAGPDGRRFAMVAG